MPRLIHPEERFLGAKVTLRLITLDDCNERYVAWLEDPEVNRYLETRWSTQTVASVRAFVASMVESDDSYLFAIVANDTRNHVGNIKLGPTHRQHSFADVSYFIGDRTQWGKGLASDAICVVSRLGFERLGLHRLQAGLYEGNVASSRALEKAGYRLEGRQRAQLRGPETWEDHIWYGLLHDELNAPAER